MRSMQEMILGRIEQMIIEHNLTPIQNGHTHTGCVYAMYGLKTLVKLTYDFQGVYFSCTISPVDSELEDSPPLFRIQGEKAVWNSVKYEDGKRMESLLHELGHAIVASKKPRTRGQGT